MVATTARLALLALHLVPAAIGVRYGAHPVWLPTSLLLGLLLLASLDATGARSGRAAIALASGVLAAVGVLLAVSFYLQGEAFNDRFFFHFDPGSLRIGLTEFRVQTLGALLLVALAVALPVVLRRGRRPRRAPLLLAGAWLVGLALHYPVYAFIRYVVEAPPVSVTAPPARPVAATEPAAETAAAAAPKNLILIYAESLERTYMDPAFGNLLPEISALAAGALEFTNMVQFPGTGWTISGIVASQCGFPVRQSTLLSSNSILASAERPFAEQRCLADVLAERGYRNVFLGGAPLWFGGKGKFLAAHGYHEVYGRDELTPLLDDPDYLSGWGLFDDSLLAIGLDRIRELERGPEPYLLTLLTVDTHHPNGHPSRSCRPLAGVDDPISHAIRCSDQLISNFIREAQALVDPERTVIVLFSDHLAMRNTLFDKLKAFGAARRLLFLLFGAGLGGVIEAEGNHFDVAPTLLAAAGIDGIETLNLGVNLLDAGAAPRDGLDRAAIAAVAPPVFPPGTNVRASGAVLDPDDLSIRVGAATVRANAEGDEFTDGLFLAVFGDDGDLVDTVYSGNFAKVLDELTDRVVIGFSRFADAPDEVSYFYGRLTERGENVVVAPLEGRVRLDPSAFATAYAQRSTGGEG